MWVTGADVTIVGLMVSLNRMEVGLEGKVSNLRLRKDMVSSTSKLSMADVVAPLCQKSVR